MLELLLSKAFLSIAGVLVTALLIYLKGRHDAVGSREVADKKAELRALEDILEAHNQNKKVDENADQLLSEVNNPATSSSKLVELWNKSFGRRK